MKNERETVDALYAYNIITGHSSIQYKLHHSSSILIRVYGKNVTNKYCI